MLFAEFGDWALKFKLVCFVDDIQLGERTRSDINFDILRRMREAGLRIAYPAPAPPRPRGGEAEGRPEDVSRAASAAVRPASQPMIACLRARPQW